GADGYYSAAQLFKSFNNRKLGVGVAKTVSEAGGVYLYALIFFGKNFEYLVRKGLKLIIVHCFVAVISVTVYKIYVAVYVEKVVGFNVVQNFLEIFPIGLALCFSLKKIVHAKVVPVAHN